MANRSGRLQHALLVIRAFESLMACIWFVIGVYAVSACRAVPTLPYYTSFKYAILSQIPLSIPIVLGMHCGVTALIAGAYALRKLR